MGIASTEKALIRQVHLKCRNTVCVYARSVIPLKTLRGKHRRLKFLGSKPLGEYLFSSPKLERSIIEWSRLMPGTSLYKTAMTDNKMKDKPVWGRRSLFTIDAKPLLVSEFFLPVLFS